MEVCGTHGGRSPQALAARDRREAEQALRGELLKAASEGVIPDAQPDVTLLRALGMLDQVAAFTRQRIARDDDPSDEMIDRFVGIVERLGKLSKLALDAGIAERRLKLDEEMQTLLVDMMTRVLAVFTEALGLRLDDERVMVAAELAFAAIETGEAA